MKKVLFASFTFAAMALVSCSNEEFSAPVADDGTVVFTAELPVLGSRAYGDGLTATNLTAYVYSAEAGETEKYLFDKTATFDNLHATVELALVTGKTYKVVFWAQAPDAPYTYSTTDRTVTVTYSGTPANDETRDAFFMTTEAFKVAGPVQQTVQLKRPFAQLNVLTSDYAEALASGVEVKQTGLTMELPSVLNLADGKVDELAEVTFNLSDLPTGTATVGDKTYTYLSMNYILAAADKVVADVKVSSDFALNAELSFTAVPVQRNYRTNIYGALLTNPAIFDVEILPGFDDDNNVSVEPWDGTTVTVPVVDETAKTVVVNTPSEFMGLAQLVNGTDGTSARNFEGYTVTLAGDIDFGGHEITPIANGSSRLGGVALGKSFKGVIDGNNATISNFTITNENADANVGFIANLTGAGAELKNISFEDFTISAPNCEQAAVVSMLTADAKVTNVHVLSGSVSGKQGVGGIVGRMMIDAAVTGCSNAADVSGTTNNVGGIVGAAYYTRIGKVMTISDCINTGNIHADNVCAGGIAGLSAANISGCTNTGTISSCNNSTGGIVGQQNAFGTISKCINRGNVDGSESTSLGFGGIVGWIKYDNIPGSYANYGEINIVECENYGDVVAAKGNDVSGIVGLTYRNATIKDCNNYARQITAGPSSIAAGITVYQNIGNAMPETTGLITVTGCLSTTNTETQMTAGLKGEIVYDNTSGANSSIEGNTYAPAQ